jgi:hypothetical protein
MTLPAEILQQHLDVEEALAKRNAVFSRSSLLEVYGLMVDALPTNHKMFGFDQTTEKWIEVRLGQDVSRAPVGKLPPRTKGPKTLTN